MKNKIGSFLLIALTFNSFAQSTINSFKEAASLYVLGDLEASKEVLSNGLKEKPSDKQLLALADKLEVPTDVKQEQAATKPKPVEKVKQEVVQQAPIKEKTRGEKTREVLKDFLVFSNGEKLDLSKGEKIVCMFSLSCGHCQHAYQDLCKISQDGNLPKMYLYNYGREFDENYFFSKAGGCKDVNIRFEDYSTFARLLEGEGFPRVLAFKDGEIMKSWDIASFNENSVRDFYNIPIKKVDQTSGDVKTNGDSQWNSGGGLEKKQPWE